VKLHIFCEHGKFLIVKVVGGGDAGFCSKKNVKDTQAVSE
jgi:hypothetical protein